MRAYDRTYLEGVMNSLGSMLDYAVNGYGQDLELFYLRFLSSHVPGRIENRNPRYLAGLSGIELALLVAYDTGLDIPVMDYKIDRGSPEFWTGFSIAYIQWYYNYSFELIDLRWLPIRELYLSYPTLHEADLSRLIDFFEHRLGSSDVPGSYVKKARKASGITQQDLSEMTGCKLRTIRSYEQGQVDIGNASARDVLNISSVIGCSPDRILTCGNLKTL